MYVVDVVAVCGGVVAVAAAVGVCVLFVSCSCCGWCWRCVFVGDIIAGVFVRRRCCCSCRWFRFYVFMIVAAAVVSDAVVGVGVVCVCCGCV